MPIVALAVVAAVRLAGRKPLQWAGAFCAAIDRCGFAPGSGLDQRLRRAPVVAILRRLVAPGLDQCGTTGCLDLGVSLVCIVGPFLARLVDSEVSSGAARVRHHGRGFAWFALLFVLLYNCGRGVLHARAVAALGSRMYREAAPLQVAAMPDSVNPLRWRGIVETSDGFVVEDLNLAGDLSAARSMFFRKPEADPALDAARRTTTFQEFLRFSQYPLWKVTPLPAPEGSKVVEVFDLRFGTPWRRGLWSARWWIPGFSPWDRPSASAPCGQDKADYLAI